MYLSRKDEQKKVSYSSSYMTKTHVKLDTHSIQQNVHKVPIFFFLTVSRDMHESAPILNFD